jgi:CspA family cold shock protein
VGGEKKRRVPPRLSITVRKDRESRRPQRRGFDDDNYSPPTDTRYASRVSSPRFDPAPGPPITATVSWYNSEKGFGFVQLADGSGDAFLHVSALERSGSASVLPGSILQVRAAPGQKGLQVSEVLSVDSSTALQEPPRRPRPERPAYMPSEQATTEELGTVKFYAAEKGFGFINRDGGGKDAFVHATALNRAGIPELVEGQRVEMTVREGHKGPEVVSLRLV